VVQGELNWAKKLLIAGYLGFWRLCNDSVSKVFVWFVGNPPNGFTYGNDDGRGFRDQVVLSPSSRQKGSDLGDRFREIQN